MTNVLDLFEQPPLELLLAHMQDVQSCAECLPKFISAINDGDWQLAESICKTVVDYEHKADAKKSGFRKLLRKELMLQISKRELLKIVHEQDKIANATRDVCGLLLWRKTQFPESVRTALNNYALAIINTCQHAQTCLTTLATIVDSVFTKDCILKLDENLLLLEKSESITDDLQCDMRKLLLKEEANYSPVQMISFYDVVANIGAIADMAESYGHFLFVCVSD